MHVLLIENDGDGALVNLALLAREHEHQVRYWKPPKSGPWGEGLAINIVPEWQEHMKWADVIVLSGNATYANDFAPYFGKGYPIFGPNVKGAELELDRAVGQKLLEDVGIEVAAYTAVESVDEAIAQVTKTGKAYAIKPWGGAADKAMTLVASSADEAIFMLHRWKQLGMKGQLMLQEKKDGIEMAVDGWFGPGGFCDLVEESFEHKRLMNGDVGCNTGEMGTVIRHVSQADSKLFGMVLEPVADYLHSINYVGNCSVNCIIDEQGQPWPLEFTMRMGWPDFHIRQAVIKGDPVTWMADLLAGVDSFETTDQVAVGVLVAHGDFPHTCDPAGTWNGYPLWGVDRDHVALQQVMRAEYPARNGSKRGLVSAGNYLLIALGAGARVELAAEKALAVAQAVKSPSSLMYRTDIGARLMHELPRLHRNGFAKRMEY